MVTSPRVLSDRYELGELLGYGGMAEVHRGRDTRLGRDVAIKTLRVDLARDPGFQSRFRREAQSAAALNHPAIVAVYDTGEDERDDSRVPYIVMEYVEGQTLRDLLAVERRLPWPQALQITARVCQALDYSHRQGIVHRDIKPGNVMLVSDGGAGDVKVMDFGIARALATTSATMTQTAAVMGTAQYLSPEQARGEPVDARSDVYSTGCLLYELVTGSPPFTGDSPVAVAYQHVREDPLPPSQLVGGLPPEVDAIVLKAMAKNPVNRYQSAAEMRLDCERAVAGAPIAATPLLDAQTVALARPPGGGSTTTLPAQRAPDRGRRLGFLLLALAVLGLLVGVGFLVRSLTSGPVQVTVPDVTKETVAAARTELSNNHLQLGKQQPQNSSAPKGTIIAQDPAAETRAAEGSKVNVVVSAGLAQEAVPDVTGSSKSDAEQALTQHGLAVGDITPRSSSRHAGTVLDQDPAAGATVAKGTKVNLVVASGSDKVPDVTGDSEATARSRLKKAGFDVTVRSVATSTAAAGTVVAQDPTAGDTLKLGRAVTISVAVTPPAPSPTPSPTRPSASPSSPSPSPSSPSASPSSPSPSPSSPSASPSRH